ncbi:MAG: head GIN domain-containing protein [Treponema sp.]
MRKLIYILILAFTIGSTGCVINGRMGNGLPEKHAFSVADFKNITLTGKMAASIVQGSAYKLEVELDSNLFDVFNVYVSNSTLHLGFNKGTPIQWYRTCNVRVQLPSLASLDMSGSGNVDISDFTDSDNEMAIVQRGFGIINVGAIVKNLAIKVHGSGTVTAKGRAGNLSFNGRGSGILHAFDLDSEQVRITHAGSGDMEVTAKKSLAVDLSGRSRVRYKGKPENQQIKTVGRCTVERVE